MDKDGLLITPYYYRRLLHIKIKYANFAEDFQSEKKNYMLDLDYMILGP